MILVGISLVGACLLLLAENRALRTEKRRLENNQEALLDDIRLYKTRSDKWAASVRVLELSKSELRKSNLELLNTVDDLRVKLKRVESLSSTASQTEVNVQTAVKDSIVYARDEAENVKVIRWSDSWVSVNGLVSGDSAGLRILSRDTLKQVVYRVPKRFLFFRFGTKAIRQEIVSSNPHTIITYTEYIELPKNRKR